jgi:DNA-binding transcriptional MerR regulator
MAGKARVQKRLYYKIGEACKALGIQPYVLRYWETEFPALAPSKSRSGQRVYNEKEIGIIRRIKELLYEEGYTIAGAKKKLESELASGALPENDEAAPLEVEAPGENPSDDTEKASEPPSPPPPTPSSSPPARRTARPSPPAPPAPPAPIVQPAPSLDTDAAERIQTLRSGITRALQEARELLDLLSAKSP